MPVADYPCNQAIALIDLGNEGFECNRDLTPIDLLTHRQLLGDH
jgi:hypothetical protein